MKTTYIKGYNSNRKKKGVGRTYAKQAWQPRWKEIKKREYKCIISISNWGREREKNKIKLKYSEENESLDSY